MCSHVKNGQYSISTYSAPIPPAAPHAATGAAGWSVLATKTDDSPRTMGKATHGG